MRCLRTAISMLDITSMVDLKGTDSIFGQEIVQPTGESLRMVWGMATDYGFKAEIAIKGTIWTIERMVRASLHGPVGTGTSGPTSMTYVMATERWRGLMGAGTKDSGNSVCSTDKVKPRSVEGHQKEGFSRIMCWFQRKREKQRTILARQQFMTTASDQSRRNCSKPRT